MGLTSVGDISVLYSKIEELQILVDEQNKNIQLQLDALQAIAYEGEILKEADISWDVVRRKRDYILKSTDWIMTPGATLDQAAWAEYRQNLRDLPQTYSKTGLKSIKWPKKPAVSGPNTIVTNG